jgi:transposase
LRSYAKFIERRGIHVISIVVNEQVYVIVMTKNFKNDRKEPYIYFISNRNNAHEILRHYAERWKIECCFRHLKTNGFDIEVMNFKKDQKIELMMGVVAMTYALAIRVGILSHIIKPISMKKYKNGKKYLEISVFRKGMEIIEAILTGINDFVRYLCRTVESASFNPYVNKVVVKNVQ